MYIIQAWLGGPITIQKLSSRDNVDMVGDNDNADMEGDYDNVYKSWFNSTYTFTSL